MLARLDREAPCGAKGGRNPSSGLRGKGGGCELQIQFCSLARYRSKRHKRYRATLSESRQASWTVFTRSIGETGLVSSFASGQFWHTHFHSPEPV